MEEEREGEQVEEGLEQEEEQEREEQEGAEATPIGEPLRARVVGAALSSARTEQRDPGRTGRGAATMIALFNKLLDWFKALFWKEEMELTLVGLQYSGKTTFVNVIAVSAPGSPARGPRLASPAQRRPEGLGWGSPWRDGANEGVGGLVHAMLVTSLKARIWSFPRLDG